MLIQPRKKKNLDYDGKLRTEGICMGFVTYSPPKLERHTHKVIKPFPTIYSFIRYSCTLEV